MDVGIEKIGAYPGSLRVDLEWLALERGEDVEIIRNNLLLKEASKVPLWEDSVTLAVNAASQILTDEDKEQIGLFIIGSETGLDMEKALSTWAHQHLGLPSSCRVFELKVACHAGTAAMRMAESWIASGLNRGRKALVVTSDMSYSGLGQGRVEFSMGSGAIAMLLSDTPAFARLEPGRSGIYTEDVTDVIRPLPWKEMAADVDESLFAYLDGLEYAFEDYCEALRLELGDDVQIQPEFFDHHVYHVPFPGISRAAHSRFCEVHGIHEKAKVTQSFDAKVRPSLTYPRQFGATYAGSVFLALLSTIGHSDGVAAGNRVGVYSYGSGSCAEFLSMALTEDSRALAQQACGNVDALLAQRHTMGLEEYETLDQTRSKIVQQADFKPDLSAHADHYDRTYRGSGRLVLDQVDTYRRDYRIA